jgi:hypothetical protein
MLVTNIWQNLHNIGSVLEEKKVFMVSDGIKNVLKLNAFFRGLDYKSHPGCFGVRWNCSVFDFFFI